MKWEDFSKANRERTEADDGFQHHLEDWSLSDWMTALVGEFGEAANVVKKLNRFRDDVRGNTESRAVLKERLASELADCFIYLDLAAQAAGINFQQAVIDTFNAKSKKIGYPKMLPEQP